MPLSEFEKKRIEKIFTDYCEKKVPPQYRNELRVEFQIRGNDVCLFECRPPWRREGEWTSSKIARFKKDPQTETWQLSWADRNNKCYNERFGSSLILSNGSQSRIDLTQNVTGSTSMFMTPMPVRGGASTQLRTNQGYIR